ncbi:MAG: FHA domain-containing protein [Chloroflexota bacterium]
MSMLLVEETFEVYTQMRSGGKNAKATLEALRMRIEMMQPGERAEMVRRVREWEEAHRAALKDPNAPLARSTQVVEPLKPMPPVKPQSGKLAPCPRCGKMNEPGEVFCVHCGTFLSTDSSPHETTRFEEPDVSNYGSDFFGEDSTLVLIVAADSTAYRIQPQRFKHETVIGRSEGSTMKPDIDLSVHNASEMGVSRLHVALNYNAKNCLLSVSDMKSANGTFINGQKLFPQEVRVLRDGDELRVGRLVLRAFFQHPEA